LTLVEEAKAGNFWPLSLSIGNLYTDVKGCRGLLDSRAIIKGVFKEFDIFQIVSHFTYVLQMDNSMLHYHVNSICSNNKIIKRNMRRLRMWRIWRYADHQTQIWENNTSHTSVRLQMRKLSLQNNSETITVKSNFVKCMT